MFLFTCSSKSKKTISLGKFGGRALPETCIFLNNILIILALHGSAS